MTTIEEKRKELEEQGELYMQELWMELGYRIVEEPKTYKILAEYINRKINLGIKMAREEFIKYLERLSYKLNMYYFDTGNPINENYLRELNEINDKIHELKKTLVEKKHEQPKI